ncbi:MAG: xanthine dehydrogenase family protein molybdopterin-binding subunit [Parvibaculum sp.]|uniref:xanthine dehydrogenase family protein molybdopterin-binding subunit n=1 Tax=Parvibaculum sp. TaxID=2024848 RepID=UPI0025E63850|nr:xanthine dehydrogenase family protein molybdopterin-binding subunit [Parvibaculum sp.]MCE9650294.1 xanthine dehydrogenase family protein molybdopterin-binding subunit [Parvibaculum sp.]
MSGLVRALSQRYAAGQGRYVRDIAADALAAVIVRSEMAHGVLKTVHLGEARTAPGVRAALAWRDTANAVDPMPPVWNLPGEQAFESLPLARGKLTWVGQPVAIVVADTLAEARAAAALVTVEADALPPVMTIDESMRAPPIHPGWSSNELVTAEWHIGDVDGAFAAAHLVVEETFHSGRVAALPLEGRAVLALYDAGGPSLTLYTSTQSVHQVRQTVAASLRMAEHRIRVIAPDVGGAFGQKACAYGEEVLLAHLAMRLKRSVRWAEEREESFTASVHGRDARVSIALALDADGRIAALRSRIALDKGAEPYATSLGTAWTTGMLMTGPYAIAAVDIQATAHMTNKTPTGAYRGFGHPEGNFALESALDIAAARLGINPVALRRRNLVPPEAMPALAATGLVLDSGRYEEMLDLALAHPRYAEMRNEVRRAKAAGKAAGVGLACFTEVSNFGPSALAAFVGIKQGGFELSAVRMEPSGHVRVFSGQTAMGQGLEHALARQCADVLTIDAEDVAVSYGDTDSSAYTAYGSGGSRGAGVGGSAVFVAAGKLAEKLKALAAHLLDADAGSLVLAQGGVQMLGDPARRVSIAELARTAYLGAQLPVGMEPGLEVRVGYEPPGFGVSYGICIAQVEFDAATGRIDIKRLIFGHDCGTQIEPPMVREQIVGGVAQAIGATLYEEMRYDAAGQPLTLSMQDYPVPLAGDMPPIELVHLETPCPFSANGAKGAGESGTIPVAAAISNALRAALGRDEPALHTLPMLPWNFFR